MGAFGRRALWWAAIGSIAAALACAEGSDPPPRRFPCSADESVTCVQYTQYCETLIDLRTGQPGPPRCRDFPSPCDRGEYPPDAYGDPDPCACILHDTCVVLRIGRDQMNVDVIRARPEPGMDGG